MSLPKFAFVLTALWILNANGADLKQNAGADRPMGSGTIEGMVTFLGQIPKSSIPDDAGARRDLLRVDRASRGVADTVVWLRTESLNEAERVLVKPLEAVSMDQRNHEFIPRVIAVREGQPVRFSNSDPANHNVRASSAKKSNEFNVFTGIDGSFIHSFTVEPDSKPVRIGCDIHPWMRGWIYVFEHPYFAVTDERGRFRIDSVPAGRYTLAARQPDIRFAREESITVSSNETTRVRIEIRAPEAVKE